MILLPAITAIVAAAFAVVVLRQYAGHHKTYQLMWVIGFVMFAIAAFAGFLARSGATDAEYRVFYLFGAILNVAWLSLGTLYLLVRRRWANLALGFVVVLSAIATYAVINSPVDVAAAATSGKGFADSWLPRVLAGVGSGVGTVVLVGGALWSAWIFLRKRHNGRRALANVIIAVGVSIVALGGTATFTGADLFGLPVLEVGNLVGLSVIFAGFLLIG